MRTIRLSGGDLGREEMFVRCDLANASSPVEVDYCADGERKWEPTQYQAADCRNTVSGLIEIARQIASRAVDMPRDEFACDAVTVS